MAYTPTAWTQLSAPFINATNLNKIEQGIVDITDSAATHAALGQTLLTGATGDGVTDDQAAIQTAETAAQAAGYELFIPPGTYLIGTSITFNVPVRFSQGAKFIAATGVTLTFTDEVYAGLYDHIFDWQGTGTYVLNKTQRIPVTWMGADTSGVSDCQPNAQMAQSAISAGIIYYPSGTFLHNSAVTNTKNAVSVMGLIESTIIVKGSLTANVFEWEPADITASNLRRCNFSSLQFQTAAGSSHTAGAFIQIKAARDFYIRDIIGTNPYIGLLLYSCQQYHCYHVDMVNNTAKTFIGDSAFWLNESTTALNRNHANAFWIACVARNPSGTFAEQNFGMRIGAADGVYIQQCYFGNNITTNLRVTPAAADSQVTGIRIIGNWFDPVGASGTCLSFTGTTTASYGLAVIQNNLLSGGGTGLIGIHLNTGPSNGTLRQVTISGNEIHYTKNAGIQVGARADGLADAATDLKIIGNRMRSCGLDGGIGINLLDTSYFSVEDNDVGYSHVPFGGAVTDSGAATGLIIGTDCDHYRVVGNNLLGNTASLGDAGGSDKYFAANRLIESTPTVASAATVTLPGYSKTVKISGTTNITSITAGQKDQEAVLIFAGILTVTDGSNLKLAGDFVTSADDTLTLVCDGTNWYETGRSAN